MAGVRRHVCRVHPLIGAAIAAGVLLRLAFAFGYWTGQPLTHDEREYLALATNLAQGRGFEPDLPLEPRAARADTFGRAPLYPVAIAPLTWLDADLRDGRLPPSAPAAVRLAQCLGGIAIVLGAAALARRIGGGAAAVAAAWLAAVHPALSWISAYALSEALFAPLVMATMLVLGRAVDRRWSDTAERPGDRPRTLAAGALTGLAALVRPSALLAAPLVVVYFLARRQSRLALAFAGGTAAALAPWAIPTTLEHGRVILVSAQGGVNFWIGNHPLAIGDGDLAANPRLKLANLALRERHAGLGPEALEPIYYREAFDWIRREPLAWLGLLSRKAFYTVVPVGPSYRLHSGLYYWASVVPYLLLLPLAWLGLRTAVRSPAPPVAIFLFGASTLASSIIFFPHERFRIPLVDPALVVLASIWIGGLAAQRRRPS